MARITIDQRIEKTEEAIVREELLIEDSKTKIKNLKTELKKLKSEKEREFANEVLKLIKQKGINCDKFLSDLKIEDDLMKTETTCIDTNKKDAGITYSSEDSLNESTEN
ncbi:MAG: hypothetical protein Q4F95_02035 [Oscillospiraceae bacterium]|nr:hypothetical protein [Oscillospiraceae bacterium]